MSSGVTRIVPNLAPAPVTPSSACCSWAAKPLTVLTSSGISSARRWY
jgi:hypothetical protein